MSCLIHFYHRFMSRIIHCYQWLQKFRWFSVLDILATQFWFVIINPSYVFFAIIALTLGTMGVWIDLLPFGIESLDELESKITKISAFTFCVATLGNFATESYFEKKDPQKITNELKSNLGIFSWSICLFLTFYSYVNDDNILVGLWSTIIFWLAVNVDKPAFSKVDRKTLDNMAGTDSDEREIGGVGL